MGPTTPAPAVGPGGQQYGSAIGNNQTTYTPPANTQPSQEEQQRLANEKAIHDRKLSGNMGGMQGATDSLTNVSTQPSNANSPASLPASLTGGADVKGKNDFSSQLVPTSTPKVSAALIPNQTFTVLKGTPIRCTLDTAINSDNPSFPVCHVSKPVYGMDGRVVLIEPGSQIDGEIPKGPDRGKSRAGALWGRIVTTEGVAMNVNSPATDLLGAGGMDGSIDNHYCQRYCGAFLYSAIEDLMQAGVSAAGSSSGSGTNIVLPQNTMSSGQSTAGSILTENKDVQPTFSKNQGDEITITVARDLDFSSAYHLSVVSQ